MSEEYSTKREGFVYFVAALEVGRVKIGQSTYPEGRYRGLAASSPMPLTLLGIVPNENLEPLLHAMFAGDRVHGEWFNLTSEIYTWIEKHTSMKSSCRYKTQDDCNNEQWIGWVEKCLAISPPSSDEDWDDGDWETEAAECCTYAAETIVEAGHAGKAGVLLGIATNILIRSRYQAVTGETPGSTPSKLVTKMRNNLAFDPTEVDWLADALGGSATTSPIGLSRVIRTLREVLDGLTGEVESE